MKASQLPQPIPDLIEGILPAEEVSLLAGASGAGKTFLTFHLVRAIQNNTPFFGHSLLRDNMKVGYIAGDRTWRAYAYTIRQVGVDPEKLDVRSLINDATIDANRMITDKVKFLIELMESLMPCDLLIVDPLVSFFAASPKEYHLMAPALIALNRWCDQRHTTVLGTHHSTKARTDFTFKRPTDRINGSMALLGFSSSQIFLMEPEKGGPPCHQLFVNSHTAKPTIINLRRTENGTFEAVGELNAFAEEEGGDLDATSLAILDVLPPQGSGMSVGREYICAAVRKVSPTTIDRRLARLLKTGLIARAAYGEYQRVL